MIVRICIGIVLLLISMIFVIFFDVLLYVGKAGQLEFMKINKAIRDWALEGLE